MGFPETPSISFRYPSDHCHNWLRHRCPRSDSFSLVFKWQHLSCNRRLELYQVLLLQPPALLTAPAQTDIVRLEVEQIHWPRGHMRLDVYVRASLCCFRSLSAQTSLRARTASVDMWRNQLWQSLEKGCRKARLGVWDCPRFLYFYWSLVWICRSRHVKGLKERLFIRTETHYLQMFGVIPFVTLQNDT